MLKHSVFFQNFLSKGDSFLSPLTQSRPFSSLRVASLTLGQRWDSFLSSDKRNQEYPSVCVHSGLIPTRDVVQKINTLAPKQALFYQGHCVALFCSSKTDSSFFHEKRSEKDLVEQGFHLIPIDCFLIQTLPDLLEANRLFLLHDALTMSSDEPLSPLIHCHGNSSHVIVGKNLKVIGSVTIDTEKGPVVIGDHVTLRAPLSIEGPCFIGDHCQVSWACLRPYCSIGDHCKISGELSHSVFESYVNKAHSGFIGHSYVSSWVNMGAMTTTSNMKNTYGHISYADGLSKRDSGKIFLGSFIAPYVTLGIGTLLSCGSVLETGLNFFGGSLCPPSTPPFVWRSFSGWEIYNFSKMINVFSKMKRRRDRCFNEEEEKKLSILYEKTKKRREIFFIENRRQREYV